jgi:malate synthase
VPINNLMEDAATAEISRAQLWQWIRHSAALDDGRKIDLALFRRVLSEELARLSKADAAAPLPYKDAAQLLDQITAAREFVSFLTLAAYPKLP